MDEHLIAIAEALEIEDWLTASDNPVFRDYLVERIVAQGRHLAYEVKRLEGELDRAADRECLTCEECKGEIGDAWNEQVYCDSCWQDGMNCRECGENTAGKALYCAKCAGKAETETAEDEQEDDDDDADPDD